MPGFDFKANRIAFKIFTPSMTMLFHLHGGQSRSVAATLSSTFGFTINP